MPQDKHLVDAVAALRTIAHGSGLRDSERKAIQGELREIDEMQAKLEDGRFEIAVFGEINAGKSALLNALLGREVFSVAAKGGETRVRSREEWKPDVSEIQSVGGKLVVVDTPGLNEVDGAARADIAERTVRQSDIVLFVVKSDINDVEFDAIKRLNALNKPLILVINQIDRLRKQELEETVASIKRKLAGIIDDRDIVFAAGRPRPKTVLRIDANGNEIEEEREQKPIIEDLQARILEVLIREGKAIVALNASLFAADVSERIAKLKTEARQTEAQALIQNFMIIKASAVALNPVPILDIIGAMGSDVVMLMQLSRIYGQPLTKQNAEKLGIDIMGAWGTAIAVEWGTHTLATIVKVTTFGLGTIITAVPQGLAAAWTTYVVGNAAEVYFRQGGWGPGGPKTVIQDILSRARPDSILSQVKVKVEERLKTSRA